MPRRPSNWVPNRQSTASRLAWLAAYPELQRRSSPWWAVPLRIATARRGLGTRFANELGSDARTDRMANYAFPVHHVSERLSKDEEAALRESGTLPEWFFDAVEAERRSRR